MGVFQREGSPYWHYSFKLPGRSQQKGSTGYEDKKLAIAFYTKKRSEAQQTQDFKKPSKLTIRELLEWTNRNYWHYERWEWEVRSLLDRLGSFRASALSLQSLLDFREKRLAEVAPSSVNKELTLLRAAFNYAIAGKTLFQNPVKDVKPIDCSDRKRDKFLRPDEKRALLSAAKGLLQDLILFALKTGMRQGEILALKWSDIDHGQMRVISYKGGKTIIRYVPIFNQTQEILDRQNHAREHVFTDAVGLALGRYSCVHSTFQRLIKRLNIQGGDFTFHDLRHTFASDYLMTGGTVSALQDILGHKRADTTRRYAHLSKEYLKVEMDKLPYEKYEQNLANIYPNGGTMAILAQAERRKRLIIS